MATASNRCSKAGSTKVQGVTGAPWSRLLGKTTETLHVLATSLAPACRNASTMSNSNPDCLATPGYRWVLLAG